jgi:lipoate-protein ligase A
MNLRFIYTDTSNGFYNMAVDEALFLKYNKLTSIPATIRFYTFSPPAITIGRFQALDDLDIESLGIPIVRRLTGGRAILHNGDLAYSLITQEDNPLFGGLAVNGYKSMGSIFKEALNILGVNATLVRLTHSQYQKNSVCFNSISRYELQVGGKKIFGSAQFRKAGIILQQGSLLLNSMSLSGYPTWGQVGLNQILCREINIHEVISTVKLTLINMGITLMEDSLAETEKSLVNKLVTKYMSTAPALSYE